MPGWLPFYSLLASFLDSVVLHEVATVAAATVDTAVGTAESDTGVCSHVHMCFLACVPFRLKRVWKSKAIFFSMQRRVWEKIAVSQVVRKWVTWLPSHKGLHRIVLAMRRMTPLGCRRGDAWRAKRLAYMYALGVHMLKNACV